MGDTDKLPLLYSQYTKTSIFILKMTGYTFPELDENGFINSYLGDNGAPDEFNQRRDCFYVLFLTSQLKHTFLNKLRSDKLYAGDYTVDDAYTMVLLKVPLEYIPDLEYFRKGEYSKINKEYVTKAFSPTKDVYKILTKNNSYKKRLEQFLGLREPLPESAELADKPNMSKEIFRYNMV